MLVDSNCNLPSSFIEILGTDDVTTPMLSSITL